MENITLPGASAFLAGTIGFWFLCWQLFFEEDNVKLITISGLEGTLVGLAFLGWLHVITWLVWFAPWVILTFITMVYFHRTPEPDMIYYGPEDDQWDDFK
jgi:hypothetical protein